MASRACGSCSAAYTLQTSGFSGLVWFCDSRPAPRVKRGFGHRRGTRELTRCWPQRCWAATSCLARRRCGQSESLRGTAVRDRRRGAGRSPHDLAVCRRARPTWRHRPARSSSTSVRQPAGSGRDPSGSQVHPPNGFEWRLDPASPHRDSACSRRDVPVIFDLPWGYGSRLAGGHAETLRPGSDRRDRRLPGVAGGRSAGRVLSGLIQTSGPGWPGVATSASGWWR